MDLFVATRDTQNNSKLLWYYLLCIVKANRLGLGINSHQTKDEDNQIKISRKTKWTDHTREHQQLMWFGERSTSMVGLTNQIFTIW